MSSTHRSDVLRPACGAALAVAALLASALAGCQLLGLGGDFRDDDRATTNRQADRPASPGASVDAIQIEIVFVERHRDDPLLGDSLWREIDQSSVEAPHRSTLPQNGWRIGHSSSVPPRGLQTMLGLSSRIGTDPLARKADHLIGHRVTLRSGTDTEIQTSIDYPECEVRIRDGEETHSAPYRNARCVFRVTAERLQDGWAKLDFVPEIHHGPMQMRRIATEYGFELKTSQDIEPLYSQRFSMTLNLGEMVVVSAAGTEESSLGQLFFRGAKADEPGQRLLVVRLADIRRNDAIYSERTPAP